MQESVASIGDATFGTFTLLTDEARAHIIEQAGRDIAASIAAGRPFGHILLACAGHCQAWLEARAADPGSILCP